MERFKPHSYQIKASNFFYHNKKVAIFADPGMGKTSIILLTLNYLKKENSSNKALIVAPSAVCSNSWPNEIDKWKNFRSLRKIYQHNPNIRKQLEKQYTPDQSFLHFVNFESLPRLIKSGEIEKYNILIIDESSKMKNPSSVRFKALKKHLNHFEFIAILSGTPTPKGLMDLWSQIYIIDQGATLGKNITAYRDRFFDTRLKRIGAYSIPEYTIKRGARKKILKRVSPFTMVLKSEDYLDIKKPIFNYIDLKLDKHKQMIYNSMERNLFTEIKHTELFAMNAGSAFQKCHQLANGAIWESETKTRYATLHDLKLDAMETIIEELQGKPLLVAYRFRHDLARIKERFGKLVKVFDKDNPKIEKRWNRGKYAVLAGQLQSVSHGLNLQRGGRDIFFFSLTSNYEDYDQFIKRIYRQGINKATRVHIPIVENTVDVLLKRLLAKRGNDQKTMLVELRDYMRIRSTDTPRN